MGDFSGEEWAALYRHYLHSQSPIDGNDCPASDEISSFFGRKTARRKKFLLLHHILDCESCRTQFEWWHELDLQVAALRKDVENLIGNSSSRGGDSKPAPQAKSALRRWAWAGLGSAAILVCLLLIIPTRRFPDDRNPTYRGATQYQFQETYPPLGATVRRADLHFSGKLALPGVSFIFELFDPTMVLLWRSPATKDVEIRVPELTLRSMREEQVYFWSITGTASDQTIIESPLYSFRLTR